MLCLSGRHDTAKDPRSRTGYLPKPSTDRGPGRTASTRRTGRRMTRVLLRRPAHGHRFSGNVVVEKDKRITVKHIRDMEAAAARLARPRVART